MELRNKSFPYPLLSEYTSDYKESSFTTEVDYQYEGADLLFNFKYNLINDELEKLIDEDILRVVFHVECPQTTFRKVYTMQEEVLSVAINQSLINEKVEISSFIVTNKLLNNYSNRNFDDSLKGFSFKFEIGSILAIGNQFSMIISKELEELINVASIFKIIRNESIDVINYDFSSLKQINIYLPAVDFDNYIELRKQIPLQPILSNMIIIPILTEILTILTQKNDDDLEEFNDSLWYISLEKQISRKFDKKISDLKNNNSLIYYSQKLIGSPVSPALMTLYKGYSDINNEGED